ncbi:hypothetical protein AJ80_03314 [Polytolypa hystricis UAMH7299]|uniref:BTB domain-containing protein n=1 Tax=Polytolypa hystricis (strain UAMH7299) TaxID=1447883 RepID=A0A2B7YLB2_POLH7|nr:hypothetical protein AJ80_03314 [Polytolypa hystricis UAMH7299]
MPPPRQNGSRSVSKKKTSTTAPPTPVSVGMENKMTTNPNKKKNRRSNNKKKDKNKAGENDEATEDAVVVPSASASGARSETRRNSVGDGPCIVHGDRAASRRTSRASSKELEQSELGQVGAGGKSRQSSLAATSPISTPDPNASFSLASLTGYEQTTGTSPFASAGPPSSGPRSRLGMGGQEEDTGFERNGIVFGNHNDSASSIPSPFMNNGYFPYHEGQHHTHHSSLHYPQPYPVYQYPPLGWPGYPNPLHQGQAAPPPAMGYWPPHEPPHGFTNPGYHPPYPYPNPIFGYPPPAYPDSGNYTSFTSPDRTPDHGREPWGGQSAHQSNMSERSHSHDGHSRSVQAELSDPPVFTPATTEETGNTRTAPSPADRPVETNTPPSSSPQHKQAIAQQTTETEPEDKDEFEPVSLHLLRMYTSGELADYQLVFDSSVHRFHVGYFPIHSVIAARSPSLVVLMKKTFVDQSPKRITVLAGESFVQPMALDVALQHLYGLPLLKLSHFDRQIFVNLAYSDRDPQQRVALASNNKARMEFALCYIASGAFLSNSNIVRRGSQLVSSAINWDTIEAVLHFGLFVNSFMLGPAEGAQSETASSVTLSEEDSTINSLNQELEDVWAPKLLNEAIDFIAASVPSGFQLDTSAHVVKLPDRIEAWQMPGQSETVSAARVVSVKFGNLYASRTDIPSRETTTMSAILLALPFQVLRQLFNAMKIKGALTRKIAVAVIVERERRRRRAVRTYSMRARDVHAEMVETNPLGWKESVNLSHDGSDNIISITRVWEGMNARPLEIGF